MIDISIFSLISYIILSLVYDLNNSFIFKILLDDKNYFLIVIYSIILFSAFINIVFHIYFFIVRTKTSLETLDKFLFAKMIFSLLCSFFNFSSDIIKSYILFVIGNYFLIILIAISYSRGYDKLKDLSEGLPFIICNHSQEPGINRRFSRLYRIRVRSRNNIESDPNRLNEVIINTNKVIPIEVIIDINYKSYKYNCENHLSIDDLDCENCKCTICLESMNNKDVYKLNCNHIFDKKCFLEYANNCQNKKITCPNCRNIISTESQQSCSPTL